MQDLLVVKVKRHQKVLQPTPCSLMKVTWSLVTLQRTTTS